MSLADYQPIRETVESRKGKFSVSVRGLALDDIVMLFNKNLDDINKLFDIYGKSPVMTEQIGESVQIATRLISEAPDIAARIISLACDEPDQFEKARKLTIPLQIEIIKKVIELTFYEAGGARNFLASLRQTMGMMIPGLRASNI